MEAAAQSQALQLERDAVPVVFPGLASTWNAVKLWKGDSGLQRLVQLAGDARVEAMVAPAAAGRMIGDMQNLVLLGCTMREFLDGTLEKQLLQHQPSGSGELRLYLAQSPVCLSPPSDGPPVASDSDSAPASDSGTARSALQPAALHPLMEDLGLPHMLQHVQLSQVNFWASLRSTRSSLHLDPYHNLLCVVAGSKRVWLAPPSITPHLDPQPITAESANHSPADLSHPDPRRFPGLPQALAGGLQVFELGPGDALYIPEGWWHQVDSEDGTLAVNFWWEGMVSRQLGGHMDRYWLRRVLQSLVEQQKQASLAALPRCDLLHNGEACTHELKHPERAEGPRQQEQEQQQQQQQQSPQRAAYAPGLAAAPTALQSQAVTSQAGSEPAVAAQLSDQPQLATAIRLLTEAAAEHLATGPGSPPPPIVGQVVASLAALSPQALLDALLQLRRQQPQLAAHLLLYSLDAAGWELLSGCIERRQEELAGTGSQEQAEEAVSRACDELYSMVDRQQLLDVILQRKQEFARQALHAVLATELGSSL